MDQKSIHSLDIQKTLDDCGISRRGYTQLFGVIKNALVEETKSQEKHTFYTLSC